MPLLKVDNSNIMRSHESAYLSITSPSGKTITISKSRLKKATKAQMDVYWKFNNSEMVRSVKAMEATAEEMDILLALSKL